MKYYFDKYKIYILVIIILICGFSIFIFINNKKVKVEENIKTIENNTFEQNEEEEIKTVKVDIKRSIKQPGLYEMNENDRVQDVIEKAGGLTENADVTLINLSKKVTDEMIIKIYSKEEIKNYKKNNTETIIKYIETECNCPDITNDACIDNSVNTTNSTNTNTNNKISINNATKEQLISISGIGESKAEAIITYRKNNGPFKSIEEIKNVSGIGDSLFEKIKDFITI